jgi:hypothetical protein
MHDKNSAAEYKCGGVKKFNAFEKKNFIALHKKKRENFLDAKKWRERHRQLKCMSIYE